MCGREPSGTVRTSLPGISFCHRGKTLYSSNLKACQPHHWAGMGNGFNNVENRKVIIVHTETGVRCGTFDSRELAQNWLNSYGATIKYKERCYRIVDYAEYWRKRGYQIHMEILQSLEHLSTGPHKVALVSLGFGGTGIDYSCCKTTCTPYVNADDFERFLRDTEILFHKDCGVEQFEQAYVLDKRPAIERHGAGCSLNSPMLDATLPEGHQSPLGVEPESLAVMAPGLGGGFQFFAVRKLAEPKWRGLDMVSLTDYVNHWRSLGARVGRIRHRAVEWEIPPQL
jgi:hypothetical protein